MKRRPAPLARTNFMSDYTYTRHLHARIRSTPGHVSTVRLSFSLSASLSLATKDRTSAPSHTAHPLKAQPNPHTQHIYPPTASLAPFATQHTNHEREDDSRSKHSRAQEARNATTTKTRQNSQLVRRGARRRDEQPHPGRHRGLLCWRAHQLRLLWATVPRHVLRVPHRALRRLELLLLLERLH